MNDTTTTEQRIELDKQPQATVNTTPDGEVLGAVLFLGRVDLEALGVETAGSVTYTVKDGHLRVAEVADE